MVLFIYFLLIATLQSSHAILSNNLGVGLKPRSAHHPLFLDTWRFNATTSTLQSLTGGKCIQPPPGAHGKVCAAEWCIEVSAVTIGFPVNGTATGAGVAFAECPKFNKHDTNKTDEAAYWQFTKDGRLLSRWVGIPGKVPSAAGLCLVHAATGLLELSNECEGPGAQWLLDHDTHQLSPANRPKP